MNLSEFKAWFEGFTENLDGPPGEKAWKKIQAKVKDIKDAPPTSYPIYIDRWVRPYWHQYWQPYYDGGIWSAMGGGGSSSGVQCNNIAGAVGDGDLQSPSYLGMQATGGSADSANWNSFDAFRDLGRAEAHSLNS